MLALMGPSGAGKSTLLDLLAGRIKSGRREGDIMVNGHSTSGGFKLKSIATYVMQEDHLHAALTVRIALIRFLHPEESIGFMISKSKTNQYLSTSPSRTRFRSLCACPCPRAHAFACRQSFQIQEDLSPQLRFDPNVHTENTSFTNNTKTHTQVRENILFSARLRLPGMPAAEIRQRVEQLIQQFGLTHVADSLVGNALIRGVSGGERRRVSIAVEVRSAKPWAPRNGGGTGERLGGEREGGCVHKHNTVVTSRRVSRCS